VDFARGGRAYLFLSGGTNHARKEPGRSRDSPVTLLHCSIRTRRIRTALATRCRPTRVTGAGLAGTHGSRDSPANPFLAWIHGSVPQVQPRPCGTVSDRFGEHPAQARVSAGRRVALCAGLSAGSSALHRPAVACRCVLPRNRTREDRGTPCSQLDLRVVLQYPQDELLERGPAVLGAPPGRMPAGVFTCNYYHFARLCAPVRAVVGVDISRTSHGALSLIRGNLVPIMRCWQISLYLQD